TLLISICTIYICSALSILPLYEVDNLYIKSIILICFSICILLKIYLLRVIKKSGTDITESMALYLKMYMYLSIISIIIELNVYMNISSELIFIYYLIRALSSYCIVKIILVEILKTPQEYLYKNLVKKSEDLEATILELKKTIDDKNIIYKDYEKRTKHEEVKNEVLANISHEFKTPVNVIYSAVQTQDLIKNTANIEELLKYNKIIKQNCNRLTRLINNFIDTTRFEKENVKTEFTCENIVEITEYLTMCVVPFANSKKLNLIFDTSDEELYSLIDKELYDRMILNLLSNAIKYSRINGNIKVMIKDDNKFIKITIEDDGIGIDKYHLKDIFSIFERVDKSYSRNTEGSGLGLNIAKKIIDIHNGNISIESIKEKGTSVIVSIPKCSEKYVDNISHRLQDNTYVKYEVEVEMSDIY
ncbi:sensor histidine kinase, partial [Clostridium butyricum]